ncbi:MAG: hypothetical protein J5898_04705, partial [Lachnospiraceae bacterium]|nr:hypothetical protein [Lachnospiraceae bacterium]
MNKNYNVCKKKMLFLFLILMMTGIIFSGCLQSGGNRQTGVSSEDEKPKEGSAVKTHTVINIDGTEMTVPDSAERIAAVYGPTYEICVALGAEERIVVAADVQFENFPWALRIWKRINRIPYLENVHSSVSFEELQKYSPDLVLTFNRPNELSQLRRAGIAAVNGLTPRSLEDEKAMVQVYADALGGNAPERAELFSTYFDNKRKLISDRTSLLSEEEKPSVYFAGIDLLTTYGNQSDLVEV